MSTLFENADKARKRWPQLTGALGDLSAIIDHMDEWVKARDMDTLNPMEVKAELNKTLYKLLVPVPRHEIMDALCETMSTEIIKCLSEKIKKEL